MAVVEAGAWQCSGLLRIGVRAGRLPSSAAIAT